MANDEKIILDVKIEYQNRKLKDKANNAKDFYKKQTALDKEEQEQLDAEIKELEKQEAAGFAKLNRQRNLIFVQDNPNFNTRRKCPVAVAVPGERFLDWNGYFFTNNITTVRPPLRPTLIQEQVLTNKPSDEEPPYVFVGSKYTLLIDEEEEHPYTGETETGVRIEYGRYKQGGDFNIEIWPEYAPFLQANICKNPAIGVVKENISDNSIVVGMDLLLPISGTKAIYVYYRQHYYSYEHWFFAAGTNKQPGQAPCFEPSGPEQILAKGKRRMDNTSWTDSFCCLVDSTQIKPLAVPSALMGKLTYVCGTPTRYSRNFTEIGLDIGTDHPRIAYGPTTLTFFEGNDSFFNNSIYDPITEEIWSPFLLWNYGFGKLTSNFHTDNVFFSPAVYDFLNNYTGEIRGTPDIEDYEAIKKLLDPVNDGFLILYDGVEEESDPTQPDIRTVVNKLRHTTTRPSNNRISIEEDDTRRFIIRPVPNSIRIEYNDAFSSDMSISERSPLYAWDGGKPSYCRAQALALGFTPEDLSFEEGLPSEDLSFD